MTGRVAAALAISVTAIAAVPGAASAARTGSIFDMTRATGFEKVTFDGVAKSKCEQYNVCGYKGTITYRISGTPKGTLLVARSRSGRYSGGATYRTNGVTTASVTGPPGVAACSQTIKHKSDVFSLASLPASPATLLVSYHDGGDDYLDTDCVGLTERDLATVGAVPEGTFEGASFKDKRVKWSMSGGFTFQLNGFDSSSQWDLKFKGNARRCNPKCRIPAQRPR